MVIIAWPGEVIETREGKPKQLLASLADAATVKTQWFKKDDWNTEEIIAIGNTMTHLLNGHLASVTIDNEKSRFHGKCKIGIEVESTGELPGPQRLAQKNTRDMRLSAAFSGVGIPPPPKSGGGSI